MTQKKIDFKSYIGKTISGWEILGVLHSTAETNCPIYFKARCTGCGKTFEPRARAVISGTSRRCRSCSALQRAKSEAPARVYRDHDPITENHHGDALTSCSKCGMRSTWPGWKNPCGRPVLNGVRVPVGQEVE